MMKKIYLFIYVLFLLLAANVEAQVIPNTDNFCVQLGEPFPFSVKNNDEPPNAPQTFAFLLDQSSCFRLDGEGVLQWLQPIDAERCCGDHVLAYTYEQDEMFVDSIFITVKCPKPDCGLVDLGEYSDAGFGSPGGQGKQTIDACEGSLANYYVDFNPGNTYIWMYSGETSATVNPLNPAEIDILWGGPGGGYVSVSIYNADTSVLLETIEVCINILEGPDAAFTTIDSCVCNNAPISFINNSIGGNDYFWEFGDGNTSTEFSPTHEYNGAGTYEVILYVTQDNYDDKGNPTCCCTDTATMTVTVDSLEGPNIYWISTLCEGDSSKYWTDADCGTYTWTATDANGSTVTVIPTANPDTVCVVWPTGPYGTITLAVSGCTPNLCEKPVSVNVPVIQTVADIGGETIVCTGSTHAYTLPKWPSVEYMWSVTNGTIQPPNGSNSVVITWDGPGMGTIDVIYGSEFLNGLPIHDEDDCYGTAHLDVSIRDAFSVVSPDNTVCVGETTSHFVNPATGYNWSISPNPGFTIPNGVSSQNIVWNTTAGNYTVTVSPVSPNPYCNDSITFLVQVKDIVAPDSVSGPLLICPEETYTYFPHSSTPGVGFEWHVTGGTPNNINGNPVLVTWDPSGPYEIGLSQFNIGDPNCHSDTIFYEVLPKTINTPIVIDGDGACVNEIASYVQTTAQDADAIYKWTIMPAAAGSVYSPQGLPNVDIQWNDLEITANLICTIYLCGDSVVHVEPIVINKADVPTITQIGFLCPGVPAQLTVPGTYDTYMWSHTGTDNNTVPIVNAGVYQLTVTDFDGCTAVASFEAFNVAGPVADISTPSLTSYCFPRDSASVATIVAQTSGNETFTWYCNSTPQILPPTATTLTHTVNAPGTFCYWVDVQDNTTGCISRSDTICIFVNPDCQGPPCVPGDYSINTTATANTTFCNQVTFTTSGFGYSVQGWNFLDPVNNGFTGPLGNPTHTYVEAGCYLASVRIRVPNSNGADSCLVTDTASICVPIAADFQWTTDCAKYTFNDLSTYLAPQNITAWLWNFGDGNFSTLQNPMHTFAPNMAFSVTLTVANAAGCQATIAKSITTYDVPDATFTANPDTVCVGDQVHFTPTGSISGILYYNWDFGDGSTNGGTDPFHGYTSDGTYTASLIVEDANGCMDTFATDVVVHPLPPLDTISYSPSLIICEGETTTLTAPAGTGYTYLWNTAATTQSISASTSGIYGVTVTDANGCVLIPDSVEVVVIVFPEPVITGSGIICQNSCVTLSTAAGFGYTYVWRNQLNNIVQGPSDNNKLEVCHPSPLYTSVTVEVTDPNGCNAISAPFDLTVWPNPVVGINVVNGSLCEGEPNDLMAISSIVGSTFQWSNGATGANITLFAAGTYTVIATDPATGCTGSMSITINPQPDLCIVPVGCYEVCNPDTICGPDGLASYQWNKDGVPIAAPDGTGQCLIVNENGSYTLTGTNSFGCSTTSDPLILEMIICCEPDDTDVTATPVQTNGDSCCWSLSYFNSIDSIFGLTIHTTDSDIDIQSGSIAAGLSLFGSGSNFVSLANAASGIPMPTGNANDFIEICLSNATNNPVVLYIDWTDFDGTVVCTDTLELECTVEPPCAYIQYDSIYCENDIVTYEFTLCNPASNDFSIGYVNLIPSSPVGIVLSPTNITLGSALLPGNCVDLSITLGGGNFSNQDFCFNLIAHEFDPTLVDSAECCSVDTLYCIQIPGCDMCDMVYVSSIDTVDIDECCYSVDITNNFSEFAFTGINICALGGSTIQVQNTFSTMWNTASTSPTEVALTVNSTSTGTLPLGTSTLPDICISSSTQAVTDIVIKWMKGPNVECLDTISLLCPGDCGYITDIIECGQPNEWIYEGYITNASDDTVAEAAITFSTAGYSIYDQNLTFPDLAPGDTFGPFFIVFNNPPAQPGDEICMVVTLHTVGHTNLHTSCCNFTYCFTLPDCDSTGPNCDCDNDFEKQVNLGFSCSVDPVTGLGTFTPIGDFSNCDKIIWDFIELQVGHMTTGNQSIIQEITSDGDYTICMTVIRTQANGKQCKEKFTKEFQVDLSGGQGLTAFPNPANALVNITFRKQETGMADVRMVNINQKTVATWKREVGGTQLQIEVDNIPQGLYYLIVETEKGRFVEKMLIFR